MTRTEAADHWTTAEVARLAGVTSRTLRHYDAVGLLRPAGTAPGGQRLYGRAELLRLQQILVLRELGVGLPAAGEILATAPGDAERTALLRRHHRWLLDERDRFDRLARTVASTIDSLEGGGTMAPEQMYEGFDHRRYEGEARERWGDAAVERSNREREGMSADERTAHEREGRAVSEGLAALLAAGVPAADAATRELVARHHAWVSRFWRPDAAAYAGLPSAASTCPASRCTGS